jgi:hypothetical protein
LLRLQLSQFAVGTLINLFAAWSYYLGGGCAVHPHILYIGALMYVAYGGLFANLFYDRYLRTGRAEGGRGKRGASAGSATADPLGFGGGGGASGVSSLEKVV